MALSRWEGIQEFIEVVETGSFTSAADKLGVSKSYISKQVKALEERFGARLLQRTTRQLTLTGVGEVFFEQCLKMSQQLDQAESIISSLQHEPLGTLRIALNGTYGVQHMATAVAEFARRYPQLELDVTSSHEDVDLLRKGYDITFRYGDKLEDSSLVARKLGAHAMSLCASPAYLEQYGTPKSIEDLKHHNCLSTTRGHWQFSQDGHTTKVKVEGSWQSEDGGAILAAAKVGIGIAQLPDFFIYDDVKSGDLVHLDFPWSYERMAWAVYPYNRHMTTKVRLFIDFLVDYIHRELPQKLGFVDENS
jgi:DNA-binding transcriptional LysR family regulator